MLQIYDVEVPREIYSSTDHGRFISFSVTDRKNVAHCAYESFGKEQMSSTIDGFHSDVINSEKSK